jgi:hypothetical protein
MAAVYAVFFHNHICRKGGEHPPDAPLQFSSAPGHRNPGKFRHLARLDARQALDHQMRPPGWWTAIDHSTGFDLIRGLGSQVVIVGPGRRRYFPTKRCKYVTRGPKREQGAQK